MTQHAPVSPFPRLSTTVARPAHGSTAGGSSAAGSSAPDASGSGSGTGSAPSRGILLAHGATGSIADNFTGLIPVLTASGHTVVAPDYPGSGETPRAEEPLTLDALADAIVAEAVEAGVETFTLLGFSVGTAVSVRAAVRHPERVRGLVLTAGFVRPDARARLWSELWLRLLANEDYAGLARARAIAAWGPRYLDAMSPEQREAVLDPRPELLQPGTAEQTALIAEVDAVDDLPRVSVPTLVISTSQDGLIHPDGSRYLADHIPGAEYAELETGHLPMAERPEEWHELIETFLAKHGL
ncbi:alpha/beta hydrolase [Streptomyces sp. NPDC003077]|uniref:alpha/beta fold hydrolase n=1 Tax=Streptomyces sp. NPDC003077 TaxID=3154443 RepID=UPI0033B83800